MAPGKRRPRFQGGLKPGHMSADAPNDLFDSPAQRMARDELRRQHEAETIKQTDGTVAVLRAVPRQPADPKIALSVEIDGQPATLTISASEVRRLVVHGSNIF